MEEFVPRFANVATFLRAPQEEDLSKVNKHSLHSPNSETSLQVDVGLIGVPYDGGVTNRPGARHGPREVPTNVNSRKWGSSIV